MSQRMRKCTKCGQNRAVKFYKPRGRVCFKCQKTRTSIASKDVRLQAQYGITMIEWQALLRAQNGVCAICGGKRPTYDVDHDHKMEKSLQQDGMDALTATRMSVRGLLCKRCNRRLLPASLDSPTVLNAAIQYLSSPPAQAILSGCAE